MRHPRGKDTLNFSYWRSYSGQLCCVRWSSFSLCRIRRSELVVLQKISGHTVGMQLLSLLGLGRHSKEAGDEGDLSADVCFAHPSDLSLAHPGLSVTFGEHGLVVVE
jgi:hypothetical protein